MLIYKTLSLCHIVRESFLFSLHFFGLHYLYVKCPILTKVQHWRDQRNCLEVNIYAANYNDKIFLWKQTNTIAHVKLAGVSNIDRVTVQVH